MKTIEIHRLAFVLLILAITACATLPNQGDRRAHADDQVMQAESLERQLTRPGKKRVRGRATTLYQLALLYADPSAPTHDAKRAKRVLDRLVAEYPSSRYRPVADVLRGLGRQIHALEQSARSVDREVTALQREGERCRARLAAPKPEPRIEPPPVSMDLQRLAKARAVCDETTSRLRTAVANRDDQISRLTNALEALKRIDTEPGGPPDG